MTPFSTEVFKLIRGSDVHKHVSEQKKITIINVIIRTQSHPQIVLGPVYLKVRA